MARRPGSRALWYPLLCGALVLVGCASSVDLCGEGPLCGLDGTAYADACAAADAGADLRLLTPCAGETLCEAPPDCPAGCPGSVDCPARCRCGMSCLGGCAGGERCVAGECLCGDAACAPGERCTVEGCTASDVCPPVTTSCPARRVLDDAGCPTDACEDLCELGEDCPEGRCDRACPVGCARPECGCIAFCQASCEADACAAIGNAEMECMACLPVGTCRDDGDCPADQMCDRSSLRRIAGCEDPRCEVGLCVLPCATEACELDCQRALRREGMGLCEVCRCAE